MYKGIFDSHAHYDDPRFDPDREEKLAELRAGGIDYVMNIGADLETSRKASALAREYDFIYCAVGVHPSEAEDLPEDYLAQLETLVGENPKVKAIGEIGLDYHYEGFSRERQQAVFREQLELAGRLALPVVIHSRDAAADTYAVLREYAPLRGVVHCFSGSAETAEQMTALGLYIGFTGVVTFKNARRALAAAAAVPLNRLLMETDCPYLAPEPFRGQRCDSLMLGGVAEALAGAQGVSPEQLIKAARENAMELYGI